MKEKVYYIKISNRDTAYFLAKDSHGTYYWSKQFKMAIMYAIKQSTINLLTKLSNNVKQVTLKHSRIGIPRLSKQIKELLGSNFIIEAKEIKIKSNLIYQHE